MPAIFRSYRRADSLQQTIRLREWLVAHGVPADEIFFDERSIPVGARFPATLREAVARAKVVLVVIGPGWATHATGAIFRKRSLWREGDWVRREVERALAVEGRAQPVLAAGLRISYVDTYCSSADAPLFDPLRFVSTFDLF